MCLLGCDTRNSLRKSVVTSNAWEIGMKWAGKREVDWALNATRPDIEWIEWVGRTTDSMIAAFVRANIVFSFVSKGCKWRCGGATASWPLNEPRIQRQSSFVRAAMSFIGAKCLVWPTTLTAKNKANWRRRAAQKLSGRVCPSNFWRDCRPQLENEMLCTRATTWSRQRRKTKDEQKKGKNSR